MAHSNAETQALAAIGDALLQMHRELRAQMATFERVAAAMMTAEPARPQAAAPSAVQSRSDSDRNYSDAQREVVRREWPLGTDVHEIVRLVNALPGKKSDTVKVGAIATKLGLRRPDGTTYSAAQKDVVRREWPLGTNVHEIVRLVNALPGKKSDAAKVGILASKLRLSRPVRDIAQAPAAPAPAPAPALPPPAVRPPPSAQLASSIPETAPRPVAYRPPSDSASDAVAKYIAEHGVTRCPAAACEVTTATISPADRAALIAHGDPVQRAFDMRHAPRVRAAVR